MAVIKNLDILLGARTENLSKGLAAGRSMVSSFVAKTESMGAGGVGATMANGFGGAVAAAGRLLPVVGAVAAAYLGVKNTVESFNAAASRVDAQAKAADRLGIQLEEYQALSYAVRTSSAAAEEDMISALQDMQKNTAEAAHGTGEAVDAFKALGISAREFGALTPDQQVLRLSEALQGVERQGDRLNYVMRIMGEGGAKMINTLQGGPEAIGAAMSEAESMGMTLTRAQANQVEQMNDQWTRFGDYVNAIWNQIVAAAAPTMTAILDLFLDNTSSAQSFGDVAVMVFDWVNSGIALAIDALSVFKGAWLGLQGVVAGFVLGLMSIPAAIEEAYDAIADITGAEKASTNFRDTFDNMKDEVEAQFRSAGQAIDEGISGRAGRAFLDRVDQVRRNAEEAAKASEDRIRTNTQSEPVAPRSTLKASAAEFGSAQAASIINAANKDTTEKAVREVGAKQEKLLANIEKLTVQQLAALRRPAGVVIPAGG